MNFNRVTFQYSNEYIIIIIWLVNGNLIKRLIRATFLSIPASDIHEQ